MGDAAGKIRWGTERRLEFIEFRVFWDGGVNRGDVTQRFGVSVPQASADLSLYQKLAPENLIYNSSEKRYVATDSFSPRYLNPSADGYLAQLRSVADGTFAATDTWIEHMPRVDAMPVPGRRVDPAMLRGILEVMRGNRSTEIRYQSLNRDRPEQRWRRITPHAFGYDGVRWHVRAFCHESSTFKDFVLSRCSGIRGDEAPGANGDDDQDWNEVFAVQLEPNPDLTAGQRDTVAADYGITKDVLTVAVRRSLLFYFYNRLRLDLVKTDPTKPESSPLVVVNRTELERALGMGGGHIEPKSPAA